jgi:hypothetical protein
MASRHAERLSLVSRAKGIFVYNGSAVAVEYHPTPLKTGKKEPVFGEDGLPIVDKDGNQVFERPGRIQKNKDGTVKLGGPVKEVKVKLDSMTVQGVEFAKGKAVVVESADLAQKLRCMPHLFDEKQEVKKTEKTETKQ